MVITLLTRCWSLFLRYGARYNQGNGCKLQKSHHKPRGRDHRSNCKVVAQERRFPYAIIRGCVGGIDLGVSYPRRVVAYRMGILRPHALRQEKAANSELHDHVLVKKKRIVSNLLLWRTGEGMMEDSCVPTYPLSSGRKMEKKSRESRSPVRRIRECITDPAL